MHRNIRADRDTLYVMYEANFTSADTVVNKITFIYIYILYWHKSHLIKMFFRISQKKLRKKKKGKQYLVN